MSLTPSDPTRTESGAVTRDDSDAPHAHLTQTPETSPLLGEDVYRLMVESVKDYAIFALDPRGYVMSWNPGAERFKGYKAHEIIGQHFSRFYPQEDNDAGKPAYELEVASHEGRFEDEGWRLRKDGSQFWANVIITALRNEHGTLVGFGKVTRDLTERRRAIEQSIADARRIAFEGAAREAAETRATELESLASELEHRTAEAEAANKVKGDFLAAMSHELRTPLNAIGGYAELLVMGLRGPLNEAQRQDLDRIRRSQKHLLGIINDILNFSRIEAGRVAYEITDVSVAEVMESVSRIIGGQTQMKGLNYTQRPCSPRAVASADNAKMQQILLNLLSNAMKFTPEGGDIVLGCEVHTHHIDTYVRDTGFGIPSDQIDSIFEPFVQVGRTLTQSPEGTGLGLAISRDLARGMGGDIHVESRVGEGSLFTLRLARSPTPHPPVWHAG
jgi:PAS domain S-box-containing protein